MTHTSVSSVGSYAPRSGWAIHTPLNGKQLTGWARLRVSEFFELSDFLIVAVWISKPRLSVLQRQISAIYWTDNKLGIAHKDTFRIKVQVVTSHYLKSRHGRYFPALVLEYLGKGGWDKWNHCLDPFSCVLVHIQNFPVSGCVLNPKQLPINEV